MNKMLLPSSIYPLRDFKIVKNKLTRLTFQIPLLNPQCISPAKIMSKRVLLRNKLRRNDRRRLVMRCSFLASCMISCQWEIQWYARHWCVSENCRGFEVHWNRLHSECCIYSLGGRIVDWVVVEFQTLALYILLDSFQDLFGPAGQRMKIVRRILLGWHSKVQLTITVRLIRDMTYHADRNSVSQRCDWPPSWLTWHQVDSRQNNKHKLLRL